jgi:methyl-accepting chemotaxis protein
MDYKELKIMKNWKLGVKIGVGFGFLILIAMVLGAMGVVYMQNVKTTSAALAEQYIPETAIANEIERTSLLTMFAMRGYALSFEQRYRDQAKAEIELVRQALAQAQAHADKYPALVRLKAELGKARQEADAYFALADETEKNVFALGANRKAMDAAAGDFMESITKLTESQKKQFEKEIRDDAGQAGLLERLGKLADIDDLMDVGSEIRVLNFKAQALNDHALRQQALGHFAKADPILARLAAVTRRAEDRKELEDVRQSLAQYKAAISAFDKMIATMQEVDAKRNKAADGVLHDAKAMATAGMDNTKRLSLAAVSDLGTASTVMLGGLAAALALCIAVAVYLTRAITRPIHDSAAFADRVAGGDLDGELSVRQEDEVGKLADSLRTMVNNSTFGVAAKPL